VRYPCLVLAILLLATPAAAQQGAHNDRYVDPELDVQRMVDRFENETREVFALREAIVEAAGIESGDIVADVGAGTGAFLEPLLAAVGDTGHVIAVDISIRFVEHLRRVADEAGHDNVTVVFSTFTSATLPPASVDRILLVDTYHHFEDYGAMLASMFAALRPGGEMTVVDFDKREDSREWIQGHIRAPKETFREEIVAAGFEFVDEVRIEDMVDNFMFRFRRP
jgi:ubiquinone/menaquinone biosynthesis C-methylase UbiE